MSGLPRVAYVAGYGRSGSTLLDMLLAQRPGVFGAGELMKLFHETAAGRACTCGIRYPSCPVWGPVLRAVLGDPSHSVFSARCNAAHRLTVLAQEGLVARRHRQAFARLWTATLRALHETTQAAVIIDSSKTTRRSRLRPELLREVVGCDVVVVHLTRHPAGVMHSASKGSNRALAGEAEAVGRQPLLVAASWLVTNLDTLRYRFWGPAYLMLDYTALADEAALTRIGSQLGLREPDIRTFAPSDHAVSGNRLRRRTTRPDIVLDERWQTELRPTYRIMGQVAWCVFRVIAATRRGDGSVPLDQGIGRAD